MYTYMYGVLYGAVRYIHKCKHEARRTYARAALNTKCEPSARSRYVAAAVVVVAFYVKFLLKTQSRLLYYIITTAQRTSARLVSVYMCMFVCVYVRVCARVNVCVQLMFCFVVRISERVESRRERERELSLLLQFALAYIFIRSFLFLNNTNNCAL